MIKKYQFTDSKGEIIEHDSRLGIQNTDEDKEEEEIESNTNKDYKRMRTDLAQTLEQGTLLNI